MEKVETREFLSFYWLINNECKGLPWKRKTRLRVTEHLLGLPYCSITSSKQADEYWMMRFLEEAYPQYIIKDVPPPEKLSRQIRVLCEHFSKLMVDELGMPAIEAVQA